MHTVERNKRFIYARTRKAVARRHDQAIADRDAGLVYDSGNLSIEKYMVRRLESVAPAVKHSTYSCALKRRAGYISHTESGCMLPSMSEKRDSEKLEPARLERLYRKASDPVLRTHLLMV